MREPRELVKCDLCSRSVTVEPKATPTDWVTFWDSGDHGMDQIERTICGVCLDGIELAKGIR